AFVLERLKQDAERRLGPISSVVVTVPAFFDENRRKTTQDAGRLAGLEVLDIINEPTAAALAYGYQCGLFHPQSQTANASEHVLVYDLGGGTFDVTILKIEGVRFRALATDGDVLLGGKDFDQRLVDHIAEKFLAAQGVDPRSDPQDATQLWLDVQEAKHALSERNKTIVCCFHAGIRMRIDVSRQEFEEMTRDLLDRTETTASLVVKQAGLDWPQIDRILLVGGSSRMPMVREMLRRISGKEPDCSQSPDEAVAHGAAIYAAMLMRKNISSEKLSCELINVSSHSLGLVGINKHTKEKINVVIIPKNTPLPCRAARNFRTAEADQRSVHISVVEGESHRPEDCIALGECVVRELPAGLPKETPVEVEYSYASNGRISVSARLPEIRQSASVEIQRGHAGNNEDLNAWRKKMLILTPGVEERFVSAGSASQSDDPDSLQKNLDALFIKVGMAASAVALPQGLAKSRNAALQADSQRDQMKTELKHAELARQSAVSRAEAIKLEAILAQAKMKFNEAQTRAHFAHLILGRECVNAGCLIPGAEREIRQIQEFQLRLGKQPQSPEAPRSLG
ncbi:MAG: Hsp70 family protein, partial [Thermoguttaceae bacterium]